METKIYNAKGEATSSKVTLSDDVFGITPNDHAIYLDVRLHLANRRQGTHKSKERNEISGSTRKLKKQKGTGGARKGNIRNPLYKGGGTIFGPKPHSYDIKLNRRVKDLAKISALSHKSKANAILVVEDLQLDAPKTSAFASMLKGLNVSNKKSLYVMPDLIENVFVSARNIPSVLTAVLSDINTYDVMNADVLVLTESAAKLFVEMEEGAEA
jgi:large subunit ribosomal protein L4